MSKELELFEVQERMEKFLPSQQEFIFSPEMFAALGGGFGSGKTRAGVLKALILSALYPKNEGIIGRFRGTDLEDSTKPSFFEVCPPSWIAKRGGYNKQTNTVTLRNGSKIYFRHIHDPNARTSKTRRVGANLGWFYLDQMEEMDIEHWNAMMGRLRNPHAAKRFGFGTFNPNGRDWIQKMFFPDVSPLKKDELHRVQRRGNLLGIVVNSEENRVSNGGFVDDSYFDSLITMYPPEWVERYVYGSFNDFTGKIYKGFAPDSVHVIKPMSIPKHWDLVVSIDVGGDSPWAVVPEYIDDWGNTVVVDGFDKKSVRISEVAGWIKKNLPWNESRTTFLIDPENKVALVELAEHGIHARPAQKAVLPGIIKTGGYFHVQKGMPLPQWYYETQPQEQIDKFRKDGSPRTFVFDTYKTYISEHDSYVWNPNKKNEPLKTNDKRFDTCDADRYVKMFRPEASKLRVIEDKYELLRQKDPLSAREWENLDKRMALRSMKNAGRGALVEADMDEVRDEPRFVNSRYEFE